MKVKLDFKKKFLFARTKREGISIKKVNFISCSQNVCTFICISYIQKISTIKILFSKYVGVFKTHTISIHPQSMINDRRGKKA